MAEVLKLPLKLLVTHLGDGRTTQLVVAEGTETSSIFAVKQRIEEVEGTKVETQRLILLNSHSGHEGTDTDEVADNIVLHASCTLALLVGEARFGWDPRTAHKISDFYVQTDPRTYTRTDAARPRPGVARALCPHMSIYPPMRPAMTRQHVYTGSSCPADVHTISMRFQVDDDDDIRVLCGVRDVSTPIARYFYEPKEGVVIPARSVLTMQYDAVYRTLDCFVDGKRKRTGTDSTFGLVHHAPVSNGPVPVDLTWSVLGPPEVSTYEIVECEDDRVTIKD
jgi:hypothetical protein